MSFVVKKRDLTDPAQLQALIVEHADDLERGLTILDSRLLLGQASIDLVALDADGGLVLIAVGLIADEEMFLKAVDAYSWCLEYPDAIHRLYPTVQFSAAHPPRVMFVVERMPDAFHRKIKQLGFAEVDCVEFRHLDVDGTPAMYFDSLARLRRAVVPTATTPESNGATAAPVANGRPTSLKLQKLLGADRPVTARETPPIVRMVHRTPPRPEPKPVINAPRTERVVASRPVDEPVGASSRSVTETPAPPVIRAKGSKSSRTPTPSRDVMPVAGATESIGGMPELLAQGVETVDAMVEPFVVAEPPTQNGRVDSLPVVVRDSPPEKAPAVAIVPDAPVATRVRELVPAPPEVIAAAISAPEPDSNPYAASAAEPIVPAPAPAVVELDRELSRLTVANSPPAVGELNLHPLRSIVTEPEPAHTELSIEPVRSIVTEPEPAVAELSIELVRPIVIELAPRVAELTVPGAQVITEPPPTVAELVLEPLQLTETVPEPVVAELSVEPLHLIVTEPEPAVTAPPMASLETSEPVAPAVPAPSVFSRRAPEPTPAPRADTKVSFAGISKDLLPKAIPTPAIAPPVSIARPSVEEITRAALDELVGATDRREADAPSTVAKPSGAFSKAPAQKRPRTIAPPQPEGPPIAGGPKLSTAARRNGAPVTGTDSAPPGTEADAAQAVPEGFEGLQFPNDGVLTRQWMEFLNQMAADK